MSKIPFNKPGNMLYPVPAVMVSAGNEEKQNIITVAWTGTVCSDPPMVYISIRKSRYSYDIISETGEFVINLPNESLVHAMDYCGVKSGAKVDKFRECGLTPAKSLTVGAPSIEEAPVSIECKVKQIMELGSHDMFLAEITAVTAEEQFFDENNVFHLEHAGLVAYEHGKYRSMGEVLGKFGYSVKKS